MCNYYSKITFDYFIKKNKIWCNRINIQSNNIYILLKHIKKTSLYKL